jgi:hypothetical protein
VDACGGFSEQAVRLVPGNGLRPGGPGKEDGDVLLPVDGEALEVTSLAANRPRHRRPATMQMDEEVDLPLHRVRDAVAVVELQREFTLRGCDGEDVVDRSAQVPQPNIVELVPASQLAGPHDQASSARSARRSTLTTSAGRPVR